jgi:Flp pilus assembly protein TadD
MIAVIRTVIYVIVVGVCLLGHPLWAQGNSSAAGGQGGLHSIRGKIYLPNGRSLENSIKIELQSSTHSSRSVYTDSNGSFSFTGVMPGSYSVVVDAGENFEIIRESFLIDAQIQTRNIRIQPGPKTINVPIYLRQKQNAALKNEVIDGRLASYPKTAITRYERARGLLSEGKTEEALIEFRAALAIYPQFASARVEVGKIYLRAGKLDDAISEFGLAIAIDKSDFDAQLNLGIALLNRNDLVEAEKQFEQAVSLNQSAITPHFYMGLVFVQRHDLDNALSKFEQARSLAGTNEFPLIHRYLGGIYWQKGSAVTGEKERRELFKQAIDELEKYVKLLPGANDAKKIRATIADLRTKMG